MFVVYNKILKLSAPGKYFVTWRKKGYKHKVRTYKEYHSVCPSSELGIGMVSNLLGDYIPCSLEALIPREVKPST